MDNMTVSVLTMQWMDNARLVCNGSVAGTQHNSIYIIWCYGREGATKYHDSLYLNPTPPGISVADI